VYSFNVKTGRIDLVLGELKHNGTRVMTLTTTDPTAGNSDMTVKIELLVSATVTDSIKIPTENVIYDHEKLEKSVAR